MERRFLPAGPAAVRLVAREDGKLPLISGYASVFHNPADPGTEYKFAWGNLVERISPRAFDRALLEADDTRGLFNHDRNLVLGRSAAGTLTLSVDAAGLKYTIDPPDTSIARDVIESIRRGDVSGSSFAFDIDEEAWTRGKDGAPDIVEILSVRLYDVGPVTFPAYQSTTTGVRSSAEGDDLRARYDAWRAREDARARIALEADRALARNRINLTAPAAAL